jgi:glutathione peroxidase
MFAKTELKKNPLYADLVRATGAAPRWNFHTSARSFDTRVEPSDPRLTAAIEALLASD